VLALAVGICEALSMFHAVGVVHRDLKPANVLLTDQGPKVIDFGLAYCLDGTTLTVAGAHVGAAGFMAPEQAEGREVTPAADVFALGCVLAYAATGRAPYGGGASSSPLYRAVHGETDEEVLVCEHDQLRELIKRCLSKDAGERPSPQQIVDEYAGFVCTEPGWLPDSIAAQSARLDAAATTLIRHAAMRHVARRRVARRAQAVSAVLVSFFAIAAIAAANVAVADLADGPKARSGGVRIAGGVGGVCGVGVAGGARVIVGDSGLLDRW
jgi:Protein kinase domain